MKKSAKRVIEIREKEAEEAKKTRWEVVVPCSIDEFKSVELVAETWTQEGEDAVLTFWKTKDLDDGEEVAVFKEWIYAIKKPSV